MRDDRDGVEVPDLDAVRRGDLGAFSTVFDLHAREVYRACARRVNDRDLAEDLMSVVFLTAWRTRSRAVLVDGSFAPWLLAITRNVCREAQRSRRREAAALARFTAQPPVAPDQPDEQVEDADLANRTLQAVHALPEPTRSAALLCWEDGVAPNDAATRLQVPRGTLASRLSTARRVVRARLLRTGGSVNTEPSAAMNQVSGSSAPGERSTR